jgi:hypothetical protein
MPTRSTRQSELLRAPLSPAERARLFLRAMEILGVFGDDSRSSVEPSSNASRLPTAVSEECESQSRAEVSLDPH